MKAGVLFARTEGILPAPESTYAIAGALDEARKADLEGVSKTILFNLSGHGHFDISAYEKYFENNLPDHELTNAKLKRQLQKLISRLMLICETLCISVISLCNSVNYRFHRCYTEIHRVYTEILVI